MNRRQVEDSINLMVAKPQPAAARRQDAPRCAELSGDDLSAAHAGGWQNPFLTCDPISSGGRCYFGG